MMRRAISPRLATSTRLISVMRRPARSSPTRRHLARHLERRERRAQCGRHAGGPGVRRERGIGPWVVCVETHPQRGEHEVARRHSRPLPQGSPHPHERASRPPHAGMHVGRPLERHADAHGAPFRELPAPPHARARPPPHPPRPTRPAGPPAPPPPPGRRRRGARPRPPPGGGAAPRPGPRPPTRGPPPRPPPRAGKNTPPPRSTPP